MSINNTIYDNGFDTAKPDGPPRFSAPFNGVNVDYILEQDFVQQQSAFSPLDLNTAHDDYADYILVKESPLQSVGVADVMKWTRTYAKVPDTRSDYSSIAYNFIGFAGYISMADGTVENNVPGRKRFTRAVTSRIQYDYYLVATGETYEDPEDIPIILEQAYYMRAGSFSTVGGTTTWTPNYTLGSADDILQGCPVDSISDTSGDYAPPNVLVPCVPTRSDYVALISAGTEIVADGSKVTRWMGNIYVRSTTYIIAQ